MVGFITFDRGERERGGGGSAYIGRGCYLKRVLCHFGVTRWNFVM